jgi:hypothetical protein
MQLLRKSESSLVLLDVSQELPELKRVPGLSKWLVKSNGELFPSWEEAEARQASFQCKPAQRTLFVMRFHRVSVNYPKVGQCQPSVCALAWYRVKPGEFGPH